MLLSYACTIYFHGVFEDITVVNSRSEYDVTVPKVPLYFGMSKAIDLVLCNSIILCAVLQQDASAQMQMRDAQDVNVPTMPPHGSIGIPLAAIFFFVLTNDNVKAPMYPLKVEHYQLNPFLIIQVLVISSPILL